eukprot:TRINITY_DN3256_c0_g1_i4.p1 TRINITY_DN3256_c0_g1~~TRINITY_DN3256_c0_g1_i4.p1  ORF type:complete len:233 (+),score=15.58 TRINITY_DN3256_c0_g1_i4:1208-1906(+)
MAFDVCARENLAFAAELLHISANSCMIPGCCNVQPLLPACPALLPCLLQALAWRIPTLRKYRYIVYHDSSYRVGNPDIRADVLKLMEGGTPIALFHHPEDRNTISSEAEDAIGQLRYHRVDEQARHYLEDMLFPDNYGLYHTAAFVYDAWDPAVQAMLIDWWREITIWGPECQVSLPYVLWQHSMKSRVKIIKLENGENAKICDWLHTQEDCYDGHQGLAPEQYGSRRSLRP